MSDRAPGIQRLRRGRGFIYRQPNGSTIGDAYILARIRALVIPPAWERVWICERTDGHIQASGYERALLRLLAGNAAGARPALSATA